MTTTRSSLNQKTGLAALSVVLGLEEAYLYGYLSPPLSPSDRVDLPEVLQMNDYLEEEITLLLKRLGFSLSIEYSYEHVYNRPAPPSKSTPFLSQEELRAHIGRSKLSSVVKMVGPGRVCRYVACVNGELIDPVAKDPSRYVGIYSYPLVGTASSVTPAVVWTLNP